MTGVVFERKASISVCGVLDFFQTESHGGISSFYELKFTGAELSVRGIDRGLAGEVHCLGVQAPGLCPIGQGEPRKSFKKRSDILDR